MQFLNKHQDQQGRGFTYDLWRNFPLDEIRHGDLNVGYGVFPDLLAFDSAVDAAAGTVRYAPGARVYVDASSNVQQITGQVGGGIRLFNTADNEECWIQWGGATGAPFVISDTDPRELVAEWAFKINSIADSKSGWFLGLMEEGCAAADTISDAGALADKDYVGFHRPEGDGDVIEFVYRKSGQTAVIKAADWKTIAADTWYHVGLRFDTKTVTPWFGTGDRSTTIMSDDGDNKITAANIATATFPDGEELAPILGGKNASADDGHMQVRLVGIAQLAPAAD